MRINKNYGTTAEGYDDSYRDVLSALSELDEKTKISRHPRMDFHPLQHAAKLLSCFIPKRCA